MFVEKHNSHQPDIRFKGVARSPLLPGDGHYMVRGHETELYSILAHACRNVSCKKLLKRQLVYARTRCASLMRGGVHPNTAVRVVFLGEGVGDPLNKRRRAVEHILALLQRRLLSSSGNQYRWWIIQIMHMMCRAGLHHSLVLNMPDGICRSGLRSHAAAHYIQKHWLTYRTRKAACKIQAAWRSFQFRKHTLHNPNTSVGQRWLQAVALKCCEAP